MHITRCSFARFGGFALMSCCLVVLGCGDTRLGSKRDAGPAADDAGDQSPDAGGDASAVPSAVAGTAKTAGCQSTTLADGSACASYYCGTTAEAIAAESSKSAKCDPALACTDDASPAVS